MRKFKIWFLVLLMVLLSGGVVLAEEVSEVTEALPEATSVTEQVTEEVSLTSGEQDLNEITETTKQNKILADTIWVLVTAFLVMFMQPGFAMLETGFTRAKNTVNILMKNLLDYCIGSITFWAFGFAIMFGLGNDLFGTSGFFLKETIADTFSSLSWTSVPLEAKFFFQLVFCATAATIVSGGMAERTKFVSYLIYSFVISFLIYPVSGHWIWGGGWLAKRGMWDFAGSTVVHSVGGWLALVGAFMLGPRFGKYNKDGSPNAIVGHNFGFAMLGTFILWFGWFGFNPGSTMAIQPEVAHIVLTTNIAAAAGAIAAMFTSWALFGKPDGSMTCNGTLAGLVAITAPCAFVSASSALIIGLLAGILVVLSVLFIDRILKVDDPVGAISVHGTCGALGTLCLGLFAEDKFMPGTTGNGLFYGGGLKLLGAQLTGVIFVFLWCMLCGFILFGLLKSFGILRISREEELKGLDIGEHGMEGYAGFQIFTVE